jgi:hypothetical protein
MSEEVDRQTKELAFDGSRIRKCIEAIEEKHRAEIGPELNEIWERIVYRTSNGTIVDRIKSEEERFSFGSIMGGQTELIVEHYHDLQEKAERYT